YVVRDTVPAHSWLATLISALALSVFSRPLAAPRGLLHSLPTRRSSDLAVLGADEQEHRRHAQDHHQGHQPEVAHLLVVGEAQARSEEHTSELQSRFDLVCRLLLEKKNSKKTRTHRWPIATHHADDTTQT